MVTSGNSGSMDVMRPDLPRLSVALVGLGTIATTHLQALADQPGVDLAFVVGPAPGKAASFRGASVAVHPSLLSSSPDPILGFDAACAIVDLLHR